MKWCFAQIDKKSPYQHTSNRSHKHFQSEVEPNVDATPVVEVAPEPQPTPPPVAPDLVIVGVAEPEETSEIEPQTFSRPFLSSNGRT